MSTYKASSSLGSDAWLGASQYEPGSEWHTRAINFFKAVNRDELATIAAQRRGEISCNVAEKFSVGHFNMARRLDFVDGVSWVARVRFPSSATAAAREALSEAKTMEIEVATMKFFRSKSWIPVPEVHAYSFSARNEVGAPFILMNYIHGNVASELREQRDCDNGLFGNPEQDRKFREQMARIQATVSSFQFPKISSIYYNEDIDYFYIGPELQTGRGPWTSSAEYYDDLALHLPKSTSEDSLRQRRSFMVPSILSFLLRVYGEEKDGPFRLANRDFGTHNIIVDGHFDIVGVIDFDGVMAAPLEVVAQYPADCSLDLQAPGGVETLPLALEPFAENLPKLEAYKEILAKCEGGAGGNVKVADRLGCTAARAYEGMVDYQSQQDFVIDKWMKSCLQMLHDQVKK
ncbi:Protein kinase-like domain protein [Akanthomyces lecanii RCEF 1005]|uniref:Protein kinase-like domain protein n=1 Tax=Akanthomyces lecanii RCEF 1005 TaxID=1081108 RepID=A0A162K8F2_CORDF|nr:Protein kinase-like domain protein [Akanthomyces lecanii RCEF 1005]